VSSVNPIPWLILAGVAVVVLFFKGYIRLPSRAQAGAAAVVQKLTQGDAALDRLSSRELGILMAQAARREAEAHVAEQIAQEATEKVKATFTAPFSPADPTAPVGG
jgi:hypothetical protein